VARATYKTSNAIICCCLRFHITHSLRTAPSNQNFLLSRFVDFWNTVSTTLLLYTQPVLVLNRSSTLLHIFA
jgi:hypothetical protein